MALRRGALRIGLALVVLVAIPSHSMNREN